MKTLVALLIACGMFAAAQARPLQIEEKARIAHPNPGSGYFAAQLGLDGEEALITVGQYFDNEPDYEYDDVIRYELWLFRRVNNVWMPVRVVLTTSIGWPENRPGASLAMKNGIAAFAPGPTILEKINGDWVPAQLTWTGNGGPGRHVAIDSGRIFYGGTDGTFQGTLFEKNSSTGVWVGTAQMLGEYRGGDIDFYGRDVDLSGDRAVVVSPYAEAPPARPTPNLTIFRNFGGTSGWVNESGIGNTIDAPIGELVEIRGDEIFSDSGLGTHVFRRQANGEWPKVDILQPLTSHQGGGNTYVLHKSDLFIMQHGSDYDRNAGVINVFAKAANGMYDHVATLVSSGGESLGDFAISGRNVIAACGDGEACYFELPSSFTQPARVQETFSGSTPTGWTLSAGSQFSIVQSGASRVLRQVETTSSATHTALLTASNWTNQSIQADIRPTAFAGNDRWVGLAAHYRDANNFYYVTLRSSGSVALKKIVNGVFTTIATAPLVVSINRTYRVRLESVGTRQRVYVNGVPMLDANDAAIPSGRAGLLTYRAAANFDNVVVSPTPTASLHVGNFSGITASGVEVWTRTGPGQWNNTFSDLPNTLKYVQTSVAGDARATVGVATDDQSVDVRARATTFAGGSGGDRWFGAIARYTNETNYYYFSLRSSNTLSLRKVINGDVTVLRSAPLPVVPGRWYRLRLEAVGSQLRAYVNGTLWLETTDTSHARGQTGIVTFRTAAEFDDYRAIQP